MGLVDSVSHGDPVVDRIDSAVGRVERGQLGIRVGERHDPLRLVPAQGGRQLLQGRTGEEPRTLETEGQMIQRVMPGLMGMKNILVMNR